jgi:hypothetical protein
LLARPELRDIRAFMKDCPSNLTVYDPLILKNARQAAAGLGFVRCLCSLEDAPIRRKHPAKRPSSPTCRPVRERRSEGMGRNPVVRK